MKKRKNAWNAGKYDEAIELLEKLPGYYEDVEYIIQYAKFCVCCSEWRRN